MSEVILAAQVGRAVTDHAIVLDGDPDELRVKAMRGGVRETTVCGRHGRAHGREFDPAGLFACGRCKTLTSERPG